MSAKLKPFQAATVKAATVALSGDNPLRRFLVADEVGLGKTVVARDTLAALASKARKFTVYYITSGLKVADQNKVELLRFLEKDEAKDALSVIDRVGLIPFEEKRKGKLRLYAFTPTTSFSSSQRLYGGKAVERAFIKLLLDELYPGLTAAFPEGQNIENFALYRIWRNVRLAMGVRGGSGQVRQYLRPLQGGLWPSVARGIWQAGPRKHSARDRYEQTRSELGPDAQGARSSRSGFRPARSRNFRRVPMLSRTAQCRRR